MAYLAYLVRKSGKSRSQEPEFRIQETKGRKISHERSQKNSKKEVVWGRAVPTPGGVATACRQREWGWEVQRKGARPRKVAKGNAITANDAKYSNGS